jgi:hypothetical protein
MNDQLQQLLDRLHKVERLQPGQYAARYTACCPAHDDKSPSLSVTLTKDDKILLKCWSGCSTHEVVSAVGMTLSDLFPPKEKHTHHQRGTRAFNAHDAIKVVARDALVVAMAAAKMRQGETLTPEDMDQLISAAGRCGRIAEEVL